LVGQKLKGKLAVLKNHAAFAEQKIQSELGLLGSVDLVDGLALRFAGVDKAYLEADFPLFFALHLILLTSQTSNNIQCSI
jgi:hypothetical protein